MERILLTNLDTLQTEITLTSADFLVVQCTVDGWTDREIRSLGINPETAKARIARKTRPDDTLFEFLNSVDTLPFVPQNFLTPTEGMVAFLSKAGFKNREIHETLGLDESNVSKYRKKIETKIDGQKHNHVPKITEDAEPDEGIRTGLIKGIFTALQQDQINTQMISAEPKAMLSYNESRVLFLTCAGMSPGDIASILANSSEATVMTFIRRARQKLGLTKKYPMIAKTLLELIREQKKNRS